MAATNAGVNLGTAVYMSPERAEYSRYSPCKTTGIS